MHPLSMEQPIIQLLGQAIVQVEFIADVKRPLF